MNRECGQWMYYRCTIWFAEEYLYALDNSQRMPCGSEADSSYLVESYCEYIRFTFHMGGFMSFKKLLIRTKHAAGG